MLRDELRPGIPMQIAVDVLPIQFLDSATRDDRGCVSRVSGIYTRYRAMMRNVLAVMMSTVHATPKLDMKKLEYLGK